MTIVLTHICIGCSCDDFHACWDEKTDQPCHWLRVDDDNGVGVCSCCTEHVERYDAGERDIQAPI